MALVLLDSQLNVFWTSPWTHEFLGHPEGTILGRNVVDLFHPDSLDQMMPMVSEVMDQTATHEYGPAADAAEIPAKLLRADGGWTPVYVHGRVLNKKGLLLGFIRPAAERHAFDSVLDSLGNGASLVDVLHNLLELVQSQFYVDAAWVIHDLGGRPVVVGSQMAPFLADPAAVLAEARDPGNSQELRVARNNWIVPIPSLANDEVHGALVFPRPTNKDPKTFDEHVLRRTANLASIAFTRSIDDWVLRLAAQTDFLTGAVNRREFEARLAECAKGSGQFSVTMFFIDMDNFKLVNDRMGHTVGDDVLVAVGKRLQNVVRADDTVGRLGGDEFAVICPALPKDDVLAMRSRLLRTISEPIQSDKGSVTVSASAGVATALIPEDLENLIDLADADMFRHKELGLPRKRDEEVWDPAV